MDRFIKNPYDYNATDLMNTDWDVIELDFSFDQPGLLEWYNKLNTDFSSSKFVMSPEYYKKYFNNDYLRRWSVADYSMPNDEQEYSFNWTLQWIKERYDPLPFAHLANRDLYPEINDSNFSDEENPFLEKYNFGSFQKLKDRIGKDVQQVRVLTVPKVSKVILHHDINPGGLLFKLHLQIETNDQCSWFFGYDAGREYVMETGKAYIVNTSIVHGVVNSGNTNWSMIHCSPKLEYFNEIIKLRGSMN